MIASPSKPSRGKIVVDACTFFDLCAKVDERYQDCDNKDRIEYYFQILPFLAEQGFEVLIPEAVSYEMGRILKGGHCLADYFDGESKCSLDRIMFLRRIAEGKYPNIRIIETEGPPEVAALLKRLHEIIEDPQTGDTAKREAIMDLDKKENIRVRLENGVKKKGKKSYGDQAIQSYLKDTMGGLAYQGVTNIFIFSSDNKVLKNTISLKYPAVSILNTKGMFEALHTNGMLTKLGFLDTAQLPQKMLEDINHKNRDKAANTSRMKAEPIDSTVYQTPNQRKHGNTNDCPFVHALYALAQDMDIPLPQPSYTLSKSALGITPSTRIAPPAETHAAAIETDHDPGLRR